MKIQLTGELHYCITDSGDGSACHRLFKSDEALKLYLELMENSGDDRDLSEGGSTIDQNDIDHAMDVDAVRSELA